MGHRHRRRGEDIILAALIFAATTLGPARAAATPASSSCAALARLDLSRTPDAAIQVVSATEVAPPGDRPHCEVRGFVAPVTNFVVQLPREEWNGKLAQLGCGGACGSLVHVAGCADPVRRGYACAVSDGGHTSSGADVKWAYGRPEAMQEYLLRSTHVTSIAAKALAAAYYGSAPRRAYFDGCSAGGMQALFAAQRFPWDFDGIVAGAPAAGIADFSLRWAWTNRQLVRPDGSARFTSGDLLRLRELALARCDMDDGRRDGVIGDPLACRVDAAELQCRSGRTAECFTQEQVEAARRIYAGPSTAAGGTIVPSSALPGTETTWLELFGGSDRQPTPAHRYIGDFFRYFLFDPPPGPAWTLADLDFDRDSRRFGLAELTDVYNDRDLRRFASRGGKLIMYTGGSDALDSLARTVDYYETAERIVGSREATQKFMRLFVVPGMRHCGSGGDGPSLVDWLREIDAWIETGQAPERVIAAGFDLEGLDLAKPEDVVEARRRRSAAMEPGSNAPKRPVFPYPLRTRYRGAGDPASPSSFAAVGPAP